MQIDQNNQQIKKNADLLANNPLLKAAEETLNQAKESLFKKNNELKQVEASAHAKQIKIEQSEASLYKGTITNPKELKDLQAEISSLKKSLAQIEESQLLLMDDVEKIELSLAKATSAYQTVLEQVTTENSKTSHDLDTLKRSNENLLVERGVALKQIPAEAATIYEQLRITKKRIAVSQVEDEACAVCGSEISPSNIQKARMSTSLVFCPSCGRILYAG